MIYSNEVTAHKNERHYPGLKDDCWEESERQGINARFYNYCGSLHPEDLYKFLQICEFAEFADFKYGYPHKIYIDLPHYKMLKFYTKHLLELKDKKTVEVILDLIKEKTGVWLKSHLED